MPRRERFWNFDSVCVPSLLRLISSRPTLKPNDSGSFYDLATKLRNCYVIFLTGKLSILSIVNATLKSFIQKMMKNSMIDLKSLKIVYDNIHDLVDELVNERPALSTKLASTMYPSK